MPPGAPPVLDARELGGEVLGDPVGEIVLRRITGEIGEGQHDDGQMAMASAALERRLNFP
jgi:hypothetical protein